MINMYLQSATILARFEEFNFNDEYNLKQHVFVLSKDTNGIERCVLLPK